MAEKIIIMGAAGRDFHNFNTYFRENPAYEVVAFTATQIPNIEDRRYPPVLAGPRYPEGIPIEPESALPELIQRFKVDRVIFAYSDVSHEYVMHKASQVLAAGADFGLLGLRHTMLEARVPIISIGAVRTGSGKSQTSRRVVNILRNLGQRVVAIRHPMPYGDLSKQIVQRFASEEDLVAHDVTIEEREEYEPHIAAGGVVYAGVDYEKILRQAEQEADVIVWDGGNNDFPFYRPDLHIVVVDPHRPDHAMRYHPGETNVRMADVLILNKVETASPEGIATARRIAWELNSTAQVIDAASPIFVDDSDTIRGKRVLVIEDGPTLTHGEMTYGAGVVAAQRFGAAEIIDPRPYAIGSIKETFDKYPSTGPILPAMGYGAVQTADLQATIRNVPADLVLIATPIDLRRLVTFDTPCLRVRYELQEIGEPTLDSILKAKVREFQSRK
jgi:predicted GTPase